ncbi:peptidase S8/S53 domain-containing protein [Lineolata rhizophorae]|uniref:Peptidase S8/S53 domain-containing protein n=1 Tax=Lineolata rhizophorae TaxID=578093 RepID=A0A6A6NR01_9PEZI|nr:peptidase S8/S53 domain-containing protein [Lineolata rhizophorae]
MKVVALLTPLLATLASASPVLYVDSVRQDIAPLVSSTNAQEVPDSYLVVFHKHVDQAKARVHHDWVQNLHLNNQAQRTELRKRSEYPLVDSVFEGLKHTYNVAGGMMGYAGHFDEDVIDQIRRHPDVDYVERDSEVRTMEGTTENNAPWGLARISHRHSLSFGTFNKYLYSEDGGDGVDVYIIDTGTNIEHVDFEGRASWGKTIPANDEDVDGNGHGTHCSGTVAGKKYGVAKKAHIKAVKVLRSNGSGTMSDVVKGVEYAAEQHSQAVEAAKKGKGRKGFKGSAANMSLGGGKSVTLDLAVNAAVDAGLHFAVAAGNDNADSCNYSPAAAEKAITVGATTLADERAYFSNYGPCNDIFAPGLNILSSWIGSKYAYKKISGTSMASPHIAGLVAYMLSLQPAQDSSYAVADITPEKLKANLMNIATEGALTDVPSNTANILAWNGGGSSNYTDIINKGGFDVSADLMDEVWAQPIDDVEDDTVTITIPDMDIQIPSTETIEVEIESAAQNARPAADRFRERFENLKHEIQDFVADEMAELMGEAVEEMN